MITKVLKVAIKNKIDELQSNVNNKEQNDAFELFNNGAVTPLSQSIEYFDYHIEGVDEPIAICFEPVYDGENKVIDFVISCQSEEWDSFSYACLLQTKELLSASQSSIEHKKYSREGMIRRVLAERQQKAKRAEYRIKWADNIYGDHVLTNENGVKYSIFLRDFDNEIGYSNSKDSEVNKLGTTKHIMYAFEMIKTNKSLYRRLRKTCPFIEVYLDPLNDYRVSWFYPNEMSNDLSDLLNKYFNSNQVVEDDQILELHHFFIEAEAFDNIVIRPEVKEKYNNTLESRALKAVAQNYRPDFSSINATLYDYQQDGIVFASCRKHAIIADEMGLGKTIQAIGTAALKKDLFGFEKTLVVCPASLKTQWKSEIEKFTELDAEIVSGTPDERALQYKTSTAYFMIVNYEMVLRDQLAINHAQIDYMILDEAQKVKNYATKTASAIKNISRKHVLIITGTPIENKLIDLFSLMSILDPHLLGPLWEFSYQHCLFDNFKPNKINAYYNLSQLKEQLKPVLLRREKRKVIEQLPNVQQQDIPVRMTPLQADYHASYASGIGQITRKKFLTQFDLQRLSQLLTAMRMVCNSSYLVDENTYESPKLEELKYILLEKLDLANQNKKVIIFSEWVKMHKLMGKMLLENNIGFSELNGSVPSNKRGELIKKFESDDKCKVFLSTEAGGAGLNLQVADILINFELPWNPAKKNQRIGRIDRLGQKSDKLSIFNLITVDSIEQNIALGLLVKQNLFDNVLNEGFNNDFVDFTEKGRGQFLEQMKELAGAFEEPQQDVVEPEVEPDEKSPEYTLEEFKKEHEDEYLVPFEEDNSEYKQPQLPFDEGDDKQPLISKTEQAETEDKPSAEDATVETQKVAAQQMEDVLNNGMQFLSGLMKMATGKDVGIEEQKIEVDQETGEVTMKFKMPKF
ncbi:DEAD/DEAH box helicase [Carboxylicivirga marina]|uniref:DEAD/DEAH box helicase n=1 Tax=Carboxylicivirga marina TaxID=2800988 RepID=UPI0025919B4C|nr:DEAD/DEAH box helicase [uncultured Carboxylicivirga sp.]